MLNSLKSHIQDFLKKNTNSFSGEEIETISRLLGYKPSNGTRRARELAEEGKIKSLQITRIVQHNKKSYKVKGVLYAYMKKYFEDMAQSLKRAYDAASSARRNARRPRPNDIRDSSRACKPCWTNFSRTFPTWPRRRSPPNSSSGRNFKSITPS